MKGLLKKDFYVLLKQMKFFLLFIVVFSITPGLNMTVFAIVYSGMLPYTALAYDERSKWQELAATMPYTTADLVLSKYLLGWIAVGGATLLNAVTHAIIAFFSSGYDFNFLPLLTTFFMGLFVIAISLPLMFRFGVEKGRIWMILLIVALAVGGGSLLTIAFGGESALPAMMAPFLSLGLPILTIIATILSIPLSIKLFTIQ